MEGNNILSEERSEHSQMGCIELNEISITRKVRVCNISLYEI